MGKEVAKEGGGKVMRIGEGGSREGEGKGKNERRAKDIGTCSGHC